MTKKAQYPDTPDGRYFVVRGRLWRKSNPNLSAEERTPLVKALMTARRGVGKALKEHDHAAEQKARHQVHQAKIALGERGEPWWEDGAPDYNRYLAKNTPYASWFASIDDSE